MSEQFVTSNEANIVAQVSIAFGRGAGDLPISADSVDALLVAYQDRWPDIFRDWPLKAAEILGAAEELGSKCVEIARKRDGIIIDPPDIGDARVWVGCPCGGPVNTNP